MEHSRRITPPASAIDVRAALGDMRHWTTGHIIARRAAANGSDIFLRDMADGSLHTYMDLHRRSNGIAQALQAQGIAHRDHVAVMLENCAAQVFCYAALGKLGAVSVPINTAAKGQLLRYYLDHADCSAIVVSDSLAGSLCDIIADLPRLKRIFIVGHAGAAAQRLAAAASIHAFAADAACDEAPDSSVRFDDLAYLLYTSGTTGPSKAIMITHACAHFWGEQNIRYRHFRPDDVDYVFLPLFHANALLLGMTTALMAGSAIALARRFSASRFWDEVRAAGATRFNAIGAVGNFLYAQPPDGRDPEHQVRVCSLAPPPPFVHDFERRFGIKVLNGYALSDYCAATWSPLDAPAEKIFSVGLARDNVRLRVVDDDDFDVPAGASGEILLRVEQPWATPLGYYKMPEATIAAHRNGWFHTGDRGRIDADGYLHFTDRKKDAIRRRGENISAYEVESILQAHPAIRQAAVYPVRSEFTEDEVAASVILRDGQALAADELVRYCQENMSKFMVPRFVEFVAELPLTLTNKVEKYKLRARAESNLQNLWDSQRPLPAAIERQEP
ncbi:ATP-dependent acyl-CoA ligase [Achromobacter sp. SD115]|uniref:ATP-dependent acyl-CoA ligase n=1 Tax=Achromobacter sp. SD115 TaxID=2782011 RepID=UPI001A979BF7|nr:ATP-dependent acyl-CoA ligase [Achromobacter sp. SD115]MBO1017107.1 ATP-dependent acyl-CoA ligase [Achromobacter sp. SD115]